MDNYKPVDFWGKFSEVKPEERQSSLDEIKQARVREIHRDFKIINKAQQWEPRWFLKILDCAIQTINLPKGYNGGRPSLAPLSEKIKICCIKQYHLKGARRSVYNVEFARNNNYLFVSKISENFFNRINDYMKDERLTPYLQELISILSEPLIGFEENFAIDSSGWKIGRGKANYVRIRTDMKERRSYIGCHIIAGIKTKIIPYAFVSKGYVHDNNFFKPLILKTKEKHTIKELYCDSAYLSKSGISLCHSLNIKTYIPPKENTLIKGLRNSPWKSHIDRYYKDKELGKERRYTLRANVESCFNMIKSVFSDVLRSKTETARKNELLCRIICHNIRCLIYAYFQGHIQFPFSVSSSFE